MFKNMKHTIAACCALVGMLLAHSGCSAEKKVLYFQDLTPEAVIAQTEANPIKIQPGDEIMVLISSPDAELATRLSLMSGSRRPVATEGGISSTSGNQTMLPYTVDSQGDITLPEIGPMHVAGLTRSQISKAVENRIIADNLAKPNAVNVTVMFANQTFSAIGDVKNPNSYPITKDGYTVLEALADAGDLQITGRRDAVWVLREQPDGTRKAYKLDLRGTEFLSSPAFYIQQNDIIYVEPNSVRAGQSTLNENTFKSVGFWTSLVSVAVSVATLIVTLTR